MKSKYSLALLALIAGPVVGLASSEADLKIENDAKASFNYRMVLINHVNVMAHDGAVTIFGTVQDKESAALAEATVANLPGVTSVKNDTTISPSYFKHSDAWTAYKVRSRLMVKAELSPTTSVDVKRGVVTLSGTAASVMQKDVTAAYAGEVDRVKSVRDVIVVRDQAVTDSMAPEETVDDASITTQVAVALLSSSSTQAVRAVVSTNEGAMVITGSVVSNGEKAMVSKFAHEVRGEKSVNNEMTVKDAGIAGI